MQVGGDVWIFFFTDLSMIFIVESEAPNVVTLLSADWGQEL